MSIASDMIRGHTDTIILAHLMRNDSYGYEINKAIQTSTEGNTSSRRRRVHRFRRLEQAVHRFLLGDRQPEQDGIIP